MKIDTSDLRGTDFPVYLHYPNQTNPQGAFIAIDLHAYVVWADSNGEIGNAVPTAVFNGVIQRIPISPYCDGDSLADFLESEEVKVLFQRILDGSDVHRNHQYNLVGYLDGDAIDAEETLARLAEGITKNSVWNASDYLEGVKHVYIERYRFLFKAGQPVSLWDEEKMIESDNTFDEGCKRPLKLIKTEEFVEYCIQCARDTKGEIE
jgi:hypothetical protein